MTLFDADGERPGRREQISRTVDEIRRRFGRTSIARAAAIEGKGPGRESRGKR